MNVQALLAPLVRPIMQRGIAMRVSQLDRLPATPDRVVFLGDSITDQGEWSEWFPELSTLTRGISGDTVAGVRSRLDTALHAPRAVSLLIGTNDLGGMGRSRSVEDIASQVDDLVRAIRGDAPEATLLINSVMPRTRRMASTIRDLNNRYESIAERAGASYVDLWPSLASPDGSLRSELTSDDLHLNGVGYEAWVAVLRPLLAPFAT